MTSTDDLNKPHDREQDDLIVEHTSDDVQTTDDEIVIDEDAELSQSEVIKKLRAKLQTTVEEKQRYLDGWQRDKAEFINARKRDEESKADHLKFATQKVIEDILPALDSFDMAMSNTQAWESVSKEWRGGMEGIYNQLVAVLNKYEVTSFAHVGDAFDPNLHHSLSMVPTDDKSKDQTIAEILQKGYKMKERVIRPALVKVYEV